MSRRTSSPGHNTLENDPGVALLLDLMGCTANCTMNSPLQKGFLEIGSIQAGLAHTPLIQRNINAAFAFALIPDGSVANFDFALVDAGSYLVRTTEVSGPPGPIGVPEPSTLALLGIGLVGLGWMGRRKKAQPSL